MNINEVKTLQLLVIEMLEKIDVKVTDLKGEIPDHVIREYAMYVLNRKTMKAKELGKTLKALGDQFNEQHNTKEIAITLRNIGDQINSFIE